jgi:single-stranded-DNA-specific exonuclease
MKWLDPKPWAASVEISEHFGNSILLAEQLARRGLTALTDAQAYLDPAHYDPASPFVFSDMEKAVGRIQKAIARKQTIGVWGDFDVDGQTSTALLVHGLRRAGAQVRFHIPNRARESHGIRTEFLKEFIQPGLDLLITCDTGISELDALQYAAAQGLDVILTDHHSLPEQLPPALAIINPRMLPEDHPMSRLAGVGTAFQVIRGLFESINLRDAVNDYLDLVALGTIADLVELEGENRYYAQLGLSRMAGAMRPALSAMLECAGYRNSGVNESLIGYTLAPRLNAVGRLEDAGRNVDFLLSDDADFLQQTAGWLEDLNSQRKLAVEGVYQSARAMLDKEPALAQYAVLVLAKSGWEKGVVGIAASRLVEEFNKPVVLLNIDQETAAGSVRSVAGIDIISAIRANAAYLNTYGGHPMAAGLSLNTSQLPAFREALSQTVRTAAKGLPVESQLQVDAFLPLVNLTSNLADEIDRLAPFGSGNPPPVLVTRALEVNKPIPLGKNEEHLKLIVRDESGETREVLWWNVRGRKAPQGRFDLAYYLRSSEFNGRRGIALELIDFQESRAESIEVRPPLVTADFLDYRLHPQALELAAALANQPDTCLWGEGFSRRLAFSTRNRNQLEQSSVFAILTPPPSPALLQEVLRKVRPKRVVFFRLDSPDDRLDGFLAKLSGLVKFALNHYDGRVKTADLAAALGHTETLIAMGLQWWQAHGDIRIENSADSGWRISRNADSQNQDNKILNRLTNQIHQDLAEESAFRSFYLRAEPASLLRK